MKSVNKSYCAKCNEKNEYVIREKEFKFEYEDVTINYIGKEAVCVKCGEILFVDEVEDYNQQVFEEAYIKLNQIITNEEINQVLIKYNIGKRPLSLLLGFGEITITRYLSNTHIPTPKNSKLLKKILNDPEEYYNILLTHKDLIANVAFNKSKEATEALLGINREDKLLLETANYIASKVEISPLGLQKILYYIQMFYSGFNNKALFFSRCNAWNHGPVFGKVYYKYKNFGSGIIDETEDMTYNFDEDLKRLIDVVIDNFACYSGQVLTYFTHSELPWIEAYETEDKIIEKQVMKDYALLIFEEHNIKNIKDIHKYSEFKFKQYKNRISI